MGADVIKVEKIPDGDDTRRAVPPKLARFERFGVPAGPEYDVLQMHVDPQVQARAMVVEVEHASLGALGTLGLPAKFWDTPGEVRTGAPVYGEHTREVLRTHGFADAEIEALLAEGAVAVADRGPGTSAIAWPMRSPSSEIRCCSRITTSRRPEIQPC